ncbi:DUF3168 domain-containing protein [Alcaligenaceae bacterium]|nr:DUF3168 domain-containing protein [Alcaligenaceae bacterium]
MGIHADLIDCLGSLVSNRVFFGILPIAVGSPPVVPAIVLPVDIVTPVNTICGASDLQDYRMQIDTYTATHPGMLTLRDSVFAAVETKFPMAVRLNDMYAFDADLKLHRRIIEYSIPAE